MTGRFQIECQRRDGKGGLMRCVNLQVGTSISSDHRSKLRGLCLTSVGQPP